VLLQVNCIEFNSRDLESPH